MILKEPQNPDGCTKSIIFTSNARRAWQCILEHAGNVGIEQVLLPAYIGETKREGSGVMDPIRHLNSHFKFYRVNESLAPDLERIENLLRNTGPSLLLLIHYFGFVHVDMQQVNGLCHQYNTVLVEDCAHVCGLHDQELGGFGDYSFYSIHKYLPTKIGGMLRINKLGGMEPQSLLSDDQCPPHVVKQIVRTDLHECARIRRTNYAFLFEQLQSADGIDVMYPLDDATIPQSFPVKIHDRKREPVYFRLLNEGIPTTALYYQLASEIGEQQFPEAHAVSKSILNLPVHQDTQLDDLAHLVNSLKCAIKTAAH